MSRLASSEIQRLAADVKAGVPLSEVVGGSVTWDRRRSRPGRGDHWACCPFHVERTPSFHVDDRAGFYKCFGCGAKGDLFTWAKEWEGLEFVAALRAYAPQAGVVLPPELGGERASAAERGRAEAEAARRRAERVRLEQERAEVERAEGRRGLLRAAEIWRASDPDSRLLYWHYLRARGVDVKALRQAYGGPCPALRLHPALPHYVWDRGRFELAWRGPAMIGLVSRPGKIVGIHRTWITAEGRKEVGGQKLDKQWLGLTGAMMGVPVRFTAHTRRMVVGEGIETVLVVWSRLSRRHREGTGPHFSAEAALSLGALCGPENRVGRTPRHGRPPLPSTVPDWTGRAWAPPDYVDDLVILAEGSAGDPDAAARHYERARRRHGVRSDGSARRVELRRPGAWGDGLDFADLAGAVA